MKKINFKQFKLILPLVYSIPLVVYLAAEQPFWIHCGSLQCSPLVEYVQQILWALGLPAAALAYHTIIFPSLLLGIDTHFIFFILFTVVYGISGSYSLEEQLTD